MEGLKNIEKNIREKRKREINKLKREREKEKLKREKINIY